MVNFELFNRINGETEDVFTKDGVEEKSIVTSSTVILVGRVKAVTTGETKANKPMATLILSAGAMQYNIQDDGSVKVMEPERDDQGYIKTVFVSFYNSSQPRGSKAYDDLMKLTTPKTEGKQAAVRPDNVVMVKATKQVKTRDDGSVFVSYFGTRVYVSGVAEVRKNEAGEGCFTCLNSVILREKDGQYSLSMPIRMLNPVTNNYDITCFLDCQPVSGVFTPEMIQSFAKRGEYSARVALFAKTEDYILDTTNPLKPSGILKFSSWITIPELEDSEKSSNRGNVVTVDDTTVAEATA